MRDLSIELSVLRSFQSNEDDGSESKTIVSGAEPFLTSPSIDVTDGIVDVDESSISSVAIRIIIKGVLQENRNTSLQ